MGKLRVLSGREVCQILEGQGFSVVRQRGSHIVMQQRSGSTTATRWYRRAAAQGYATAQFHLAELYYFGRGVPRHHATGDVWCRLAAAQGHEQAQRGRFTRTVRDEADVAG